MSIDDNLHCPHCHKVIVGIHGPVIESVIAAPHANCNPFRPCSTACTAGVTKGTVSTSNSPIMGEGFTTTTGLRVVVDPTLAVGEWHLAHGWMDDPPHTHRIKR